VENCLKGNAIEERRRSVSSGREKKEKEVTRHLGNLFREKV